MSRRRIWPAAFVITAMAAAPAQADDFWNSFKQDFSDFTDAIKDGIGDIRQGKQDVEETIDEANQLKEEFAGTPDEPRYDSVWVAELQQRLAVQGFDPGPVDGAFGKRTEAALVAFQRQIGAEPDGLPRPSLMRALRARTQTIQIAQPQEPQPGTLSPADGAGSTAWSTAPGGPASIGTLPPGQLSPGQAPLGQASQGQPSNVPGTPRDATYERFLEAHLALHPEVVDDDAFALRYLSYRPASEPCPAEFELLKGGEFDRQRFYSQVWPSWKARFEQIVAQARPPTGEVFRAQLEKTAGTYDFAREAFPVEFSELGGGIVVGKEPALPSSLSGMRFCANPPGQRRFPVGFRIDLANADAIDRLPLGSAEAEVFVRRNPERTLQFVVDFALERTEAAYGLGTSEGTGRIVGAAVIDPTSGQVLHRYDPSLFAPPSADPWDAYPAPDYRQLLLSLVARSPDLARSDAYVEQFIASQDCDALRATRDNEIRRQELIGQWRPGFEQEVAEAGDQRAPIVKVTLEQRLDEYDVAAQTFGFPDNDALNRHNPTYVRAARAYCPIGLTEAPNSFSIVLEPPKALFQAGLPVTPDVAQRLLDREVRGRTRTVHLDLLLRLGTPGEVDGNPQRVPATIVDARARELDGGLLHHYGTGFFGGEGASSPDAYPGVDQPSHERLVLTYLASRPELADDPSFVQRYASVTNCEAWSARSDDEFARGELGQQARRQIRDALAQGQGQGNGRYRVSIETELGEYDFGKQRFPLAVPDFDQGIYRNMLDEAVPAVLIEPEARSCRRDSVVSPSFPDGFLLTAASAEAIAAVGVPLDQASAKAYLQRDLPQYRDPRAVQVEMVVQIDDIPAPRRTHPQRDEHVSVVPGTVLSARVLDAHSGQPVFDYGTELFGGDAVLAQATTSAAEPPVQQAPPSAEPAVATLDNGSGEPAKTEMAMLSVAPPAAGQSADQRSADHFKILDITVGITEAEAAAAIAAEFSPDQIASDPERGVLLAERGPCNYADPGDPAIASEAGAFCLALKFSDGLVSQVALRQVVPGDVTAAALDAFAERYGEPVSVDPGGQAAEATVVGWGAPIGTDRTSLGRVAGPSAPTVLEGNVWHTNGVTTVVLRLDRQAPEEAPSMEIKF